MANESYQKWYVQGLQALVAAGEIGAKAAAEGSSEQRQGKVADLAKETSEIQARHADTLKRLLQDNGGQPVGMDNPAMKGIVEAINHMTESASDEVKDAAGLAGGQLALHYYVAAYGSLASTAKHLGRTEDARMIKSMADETKAQDEKYTSAAEGLANKEAANG